MIKAVTMYLVFCDLCGKLFDNEETPLRMNECHLYTGIGRAEIGIQKVGWKVLHNQPNSLPRVICKTCDQAAQQTMKNQ